MNWTGNEKSTNERDFNEKHSNKAQDAADNTSEKRTWISKKEPGHEKKPFTTSGGKGESPARWGPLGLVWKAGPLKSENREMGDTTILGKQGPKKKKGGRQHQKGRI